MRKMHINNVPWPIAIISFSLIILSILYAINARTLSEFMLYSWYITIPFSIGVFIFCAFDFLKNKSIRSLLGNLLTFVFTTLLVYMTGGPLYYSIGVSIKDIYSWLQSPKLSHNDAIAFTIIVTFLLGVLLFYFRLKLRAVYGMTEALVGLVISVNRVSAINAIEFTSSDFYLAMLTAGVYLVVRGLDNIHQGLTKEPNDPVALRVIDFIKNRIVISRDH